MEPNANSSPTTLLWAAQLKREHAFLLERIRKVEREMEHMETFRKDLECSRDGIKDPGTVTQQIEEKFEKNSNEVMDTILNPLIAQVEIIQKETVVLGEKMDSIRAAQVDIDDERKRALTEEKSLLKRIFGLQEEQESYQKEIVLLRDEMSLSREQRIRMVDRKIEKMQYEIQQEQKSGQLISARLGSLKIVQKGLVQECATLRGDLQSLNARQAASYDLSDMPQYPDSTTRTLHPLTKAATAQKTKLHEEVLTSTTSAPITNGPQVGGISSTVARTDADSIANRLRPRKKLKPEEVFMGCESKVAPPSKKRKAADRSMNPEITKQRQGNVTDTGLQNKTLIGEPERRQDGGARVFQSPILSSNNLKPPAPSQPQPRRKRKIEQTCELPD